MGNSYASNPKSIGNSAGCEVVKQNQAAGLSIRQKPSASMYVSSEMAEVDSEVVSVFGYSGILGQLRIWKTTKLARWPNRQDSRKKQTLAEANTIVVTPVFFNTVVEWCVTKSMGQISRCLRTYPVVDARAPIFDIVRSGDVMAYQQAIVSGEVSPFLTSENGKSLLHVSTRADTSCAQLINLVGLYQPQS